ncbi:LPXTG cell wall anchor domain-containing protein, partial [Gemella cuniculi]
KDGKTYRLVEKDNGVKSGSDLPSGDVEENKDKVITYVYEEVKPEPNEPIQPQPNEPNEPVQPQPDEPNEPVQPQPNEPSEPVNPQPNEPNEPVNPQPNEPNEPVNPQPNVPNEPSEPVQPQPNEPSEPVQPQPDEPNKPVQPQPNEPVQLDSNKSSSSINQNISKLPNTGAESNAGTTAGVLGIIGSIFLSIKKRKED